MAEKTSPTVSKGTSAPVAPAPAPQAQAVQAIPATITGSGQGATTVEIRSSDFANNGIDHDSVVFDFRKDDFKVSVGNENGQISKEAADFLTKNYPASFVYVTQ